MDRLRRPRLDLIVDVQDDEIELSPLHACPVDKGCIDVDLREASPSTLAARRPCADLDLVVCVCGNEGVQLRSSRRVHYPLQ